MGMWALGNSLGRHKGQGRICSIYTARRGFMLLTKELWMQNDQGCNGGKAQPEMDCSPPSHRSFPEQVCAPPVG